uniref:Uncharacterized protein n=1 Tax=Physcomitrium patens TaxID=3218 RepID=A0A7I4BK11_PHYPA
MVVVHQAKSSGNGFKREDVDAQLPVDVELSLGHRIAMSLEVCRYDNEWSMSGGAFCFARCPAR